MTICIFMRTFVAWTLFAMLLGVAVNIALGVQDYVIATAIGAAFGFIGGGIGVKKFLKEYDDAW